MAKETAVRTIADGVVFVDMDDEFVTLKVARNKEKNLGASQTGKSLMLANTRGNVAIPGTDIKLGLKMFYPNPDKPGASGE